MKYSKKINFQLFILLLACWVPVVAVFAFLVRLSVHLIAYFKFEVFRFGWLDLFYSIKVGLVVGFPISSGIWIISKMEERKRDGA